MIRPELLTHHLTPVHYFPTESARLAATTANGERLRAIGRGDVVVTPSDSESRTQFFGVVEDITVSEELPGLFWVHIEWGEHYAVTNSKVRGPSFGGGYAGPDQEITVLEPAARDGQ